MSNYIVEDEEQDLRFPTAEKPKNTNTSKRIMVASGILILMIVVIFITSRINVRTTYSSLEIEMVEKADEYIKANNLENEEVYVDVSKIDISLPDDCNKLSGVLYQDEKYYPHLMCVNHKSKNFSENKIDLVGDEIIVLVKGSSYYDLGYKSDKNIQVSGTVNTNKEGIYNVYYIPPDDNHVTIRKVIVVDNLELMNNVPVINIDQKDVTIEFGQTFNDNVSVIDKNDGNITNKLIKINNVDENEIGEYKIVYSVTNNLGYTAMAMRKVTVINNSETNIFTELSNENMTNEEIYIKVKIVGDNFSYVILPDKSEQSEKEFSYEIEENDKYEFIVVNKDDTRLSKIVNVTNIDKTTPEGTCDVKLYNDKTIFNVKINTFNYIVGYNYYVNNIESGYISKSTYISNEVSKGDLIVKVKDYVGNEGTITCKASEKQYNNNPNGYQVTLSGKPRLHIPITEALAKKGYTINDLNRCIYTRVQSAGPGTRYGVVEAAYGLIDCTYKMTGYVLPYNHAGGKVEEETTKGGGTTNYCNGINRDICGKLGINSNWGKSGGSCNASECWYGLNCATFVRWSMCNGGMDLCSRGSAGAYGMASQKYFPEADIVNIWGTSVKHVYGKNLSMYNAEQLVRMIKPGDVIAHYNTRTDVSGNTQHTYVVIGKDNDGIYTANDGYYINKISYSKMLSGEYSYQILYLDRYYDNVSNRNNLYN